MAKAPTKRTKLDDLIGKLQELTEPFDELKCEFEEWRDSMTGTNLANTERYRMVEETADALDTQYTAFEDIISELEQMDWS